MSKMKRMAIPSVGENAKQQKFLVIVKIIISSQILKCILEVTFISPLFCIFSYFKIQCIHLWYLKIA